jgi:hypothetical protein
MILENAPRDDMRPSEYCLDDGLLWSGARFRLHRVNVFGVDQALANLSRSSPVAVYGSQRPSLDARLAKIGPCPEDHEAVMVQMRSDWIADEGGHLTTHAALQNIPYIEGTRAVPVLLHELLGKDDTSVRIRIHNPFNVAFKDVVFQAHYEGGPGKPMPAYADQALGVAPGQATVMTISRTLAGSEALPATKSGYGLHSLELTGQVGRARLTVELVLPH